MVALRSLTGHHLSLTNADWSTASEGLRPLPATDELAYMDPSSVASIPFFSNKVRLLTYIRPPTAASI
jgi:hypothetical protein